MGGMKRAVQLRTDPQSATRASGSDFDDFFVEHRTGLFGALWLVTGDRHEAEELTQEAFVNVWERWDRIRQLQHPEGYLYRTGMNLFRNRRRRVALAVRRAVHLAPAPGDEMRAVDDRDAIVRALGRLTPRQRAALVLMDLVGFSSEEAADALGVRPSTVRVLAARGRAIVRRQMGDPDG
jgi:RNA polymerase sigma factor (sigma-70 family)